MFVSVVAVGPVSEEVEVAAEHAAFVLSVVVEVESIGVAVL